MLRLRSSWRCAAIAIGLAASVAASSGVAEAGGIAWEPCGHGLECARLAVPVDYAKPKGRQLRLALIRLPASSSADRIGSLVVNPGGPGASGVDWVRASRDDVSPAVLARFDLVGFDPRGVGRSAPVVCETAAERDRAMSRPVLPQSAAERGVALADAKRFVATCVRRNGGLLPYLTTEATARDLDRLRSALGDDKLTYLGFSYGAVLGATYASLFPQRVRALALDGADDPRVWTGDASAALRTQLFAYKRGYTAFLAWCRAHRSGCGFARQGDPGAAITQLLARLQAHPIRVGTRLLTAGQAYTAVIATLYARGAWPYLGAVRGDRLSGDDGRLLLLLADAYTGRDFDGTYSTLLDSYTAISCADHDPPSRDLASYARLAGEFARIFPFAAGLAYVHLPCAFWPRPVSRYTGPFDAAGAPPILVIGTTRDPATAYEWARSLAAQLDSGVLLTRVGDGHTAYGVSGCVRGFVDRYLLTLSAPPRGTVCQS